MILDLKGYPQQVKMELQQSIKVFLQVVKKIVIAPHGLSKQKKFHMTIIQNKLHMIMH